MANTMNTNVGTAIDCHGIACSQRWFKRPLSASMA
jgi:hypothetical protein